MKRLLLNTLIGLALLTCQTSFAQKTKAKFSPIKVETPARPANQQDVIQLVTPKLETVRVGFIGLGMRGPGAVERWTHIPGTQIVALCDLLPERVESAQKILEKAGLPKAASYAGDEKAWKKLCERDDIDIVYIATDWKHHAEMGVYAMEHGKHVAIEVPAAMTLDEICKLINTSEKTRKHCMQLENCVYDFFELTSLNMAQQGVFGEVLHVEGAYIHNLEVLFQQHEQRKGKPGGNGDHTRGASRGKKRQLRQIRKNADNNQAYGNRIPLPIVELFFQTYHLSHLQQNRKNFGTGQKVPPSHSGIPQNIPQILPCNSGI